MFSAGTELTDFEINEYVGIPIKCNIVKLCDKKKRKRNRKGSTPVQKSYQLHTQQ